MPKKHLKLRQQLQEKQTKLEQHIYLVNSGEYTSVYIFKYAKTKEKAIELAIFLISQSRGELFITKPPKVVEKYEDHEYYEFKATINGEEYLETKYNFCIHTLTIFDDKTD